MWNRIRVWLKDSETIAWARLQMLGGLIVAALATLNWSVLLDTSLSFKQILSLGGIMFFQGLVTEISRRAREPHDLNVKTVADLDQVSLPIKTADAVVVDEATGTVTVTKSEPIPPTVTSKWSGEKP